MYGNFVLATNDASHYTTPPTKWATHRRLLEGTVVEHAVRPERHLPDQEQLRHEPGNNNASPRRLTACKRHASLYATEIQVRGHTRYEYAVVKTSYMQFIELLWPPYVIGQAIIFLPCGFYLLSSFFLA